MTRRTTGAALALGALSVAPAFAGDALLDHSAFDRVIVVTAVEPHVYRDVERTPYPDTLERYPELFAGGGYRMEPPNEDGEWYARAYQWHPSTIVVNQGERVLLEFFGINGDEHPSLIEGYDIEFTVRRGEITQVPLEADEAGIFRFASLLRLPSMIGQIVVLPN